MLDTLIQENMQELTPSHVAERLDLLTDVSVALSNGNDIASFLDRILRAAKGMTNADGGTLYRPSADGRSLCFHISLNDTLGIHQGGVAGKPIDLPPVPLYDSYGNKNITHVHVRLEKPDGSGGWRLVEQKTADVS